MVHIYETYEAYKKMISAGIDKDKILNDIKHSKEAFEGFNISDEMLYVLLARSLNINVRKPKQRIKFVPNSPHKFTISQIKDVADGSIVNVKGRIIKVYDDCDHLSVIFTDMKHSIRCVLFNNAIDNFNKLNFEFGDKIKLKNVIVKTYKNKKELTGNDYTTVLKLKDKVNKVNKEECN